MVNVYNAYTATGAVSSPAGAYLAEGQKVGGLAGKAPLTYTPTTPNVSLNPLSVGINLGAAGLPVSILQPYLAVTAIICTSGVFPARN
jgi:microcystin-dependent protein